MLETDRLALRARRIEQVIAALRDRERVREAYDGSAPRPLRQAIADFDRELAAIRARRRALHRGTRTR
ncbi:MAG TPA: hypothetical protein VFZ89_03420 [Solirubrobacteraceae bacterium]